MTAFVIGNGISRKPINLKSLNGMTYGCNSLYKDFIPDVLVATDKPISRFIQESGYAKSHQFYTRHVIADSGAKPLNKKYSGWSSGPNALQLAVHDGHTKIILIGFDFGSIDDKFNNIYANTEFYKKSTDRNTFAGNWIKQITTILKQFPNVHYTFIIGKSSTKVKQILAFDNVGIQTVDEFLRKNN